MLNEIYQAERNRASLTNPGLWQALTFAREQERISHGDLRQLSEPELEGKMKTWRIWVNSAKSLSNTAWSTGEATEFLREARGVIAMYYYHPVVWEAADKMKIDSDGHEYQMAAEMCRDEAKYWLAVGLLLGNPQIRQRAIQSLDEAVILAEKETSAGALATMEREIIKKQEGEQIDWEEFTAAYNIVLQLREKAGGCDRVAAISWEYCKQSVQTGKFKELTDGWTNLHQATAQTGASWIKYPVKELVEWGVSVSRRITRYQIPNEVKSELAEQFGFAGQ